MLISSFRYSLTLVIHSTCVTQPFHLRCSVLSSHPLPLLQSDATTRPAIASSKTPLSKNSPAIRQQQHALFGYLHKLLLSSFQMGAGLHNRNDRPIDPLDVCHFVLFFPDSQLDDRPAALCHITPIPRSLISGTGHQYSCTLSSRRNYNFDSHLFSSLQRCLHLNPVPPLCYHHIPPTLPVKLEAY